MAFHRSSTSPLLSDSDSGEQMNSAAQNLVQQENYPRSYYSSWVAALGLVASILAAVIAEEHGKTRLVLRGILFLVNLITFCSSSYDLMRSITAFKNKGGHWYSPVTCWCALGISILGVVAVAIDFFYDATGKQREWDCSWAAVCTAVIALILSIRNDRKATNILRMRRIKAARQTLNDLTSQHSRAIKAKDRVVPLISGIDRTYRAPPM